MNLPHQPKETADAIPAVTVFRQTPQFEMNLQQHRNKMASDTQNPARSQRHEDAKQEREIVINANYEVFVAGFLVIQLINSALLILPLRDEQRQIIFGFWIGISVFLFIDAGIRTIRAHLHRQPMFSHLRWMLWVGAAPVPFFTIIRLVFLSLHIRRFRHGDYAEIGRFIVMRHAQSTLLLIILLATIFFEFGSFLILSAEQLSPDANIKTSQDAIWWSLVTISTVGYGDKYPTTTWGRFIGSILIVTGVAVFTSVTSIMARWFIRPRGELSDQHLQSQSRSDPVDNIHEMRDMLVDLEESHRSTIQDLEERLDRLEQQIK